MFHASFDQEQGQRLGIPFRFDFEIGGKISSPVHAIVFEGCGFFLAADSVLNGSANKLFRNRTEFLGIYSRIEHRKTSVVGCEICDQS